jgi:uncharacterized protein YndB with AHSA1/START domain
MTHEFEVREDIELDATPEQVWAAIATGPGVDSWFMGRNEIEGREGGRGRMILGEYSQESTVTAWEPGKRFAFRGDPAPDGQFMAFEYLIEGRDGGSTVLRFVHSGMLGDDWEAEYDALSRGDRMYLGKLASYLRFFPGQTASASLMLFGAPEPDADRAWAAFVAAAGLSDAAAAGDTGQLAVPGVGPATVTADYVDRPAFLGVRTDDSLIRFIRGMGDMIVVEQHRFDGDAAAASHAEQAWRDWLATALA